MAIVKLVQSGYCKFLVSQNVDGLHRKSGVPPEKVKIQKNRSTRFPNFNDIRLRNFMVTPIWSNVENVKSSIYVIMMFQVILLVPNTELTDIVQFQVAMVIYVSILEFSQNFQEIREISPFSSHFL